MMRQKYVIILLISAFILIIVYLFPKQIIQNSFITTIRIGEQVQTGDEAEISVCSIDSDCIVVPYSHCCGLSKRSINKKFKTSYDSHPKWQNFHDSSLCSTIGRCFDDTDFNNAYCDTRGSAGTCMLKK